MVKNLAEGGSGLRHGFRSRLTKSDAVALAASFKNNALRVAVSGEVITAYGNSASFETPADATLHSAASKCAFRPDCAG